MSKFNQRKDQWITGYYRNGLSELILHMQQKDSRDYVGDACGLVLAGALSLLGGRSAAVDSAVGVNYRGRKYYGGLGTLIIAMKWGLVCHVRSDDVGVAMIQVGGAQCDSWNPPATVTGRWMELALLAATLVQEQHVNNLMQCKKS